MLKENNLLEQPTVRNDWHLDEVIELLTRPLNDLIFTAQSLHRLHFNSNQVQLCTLLNIKTGACSEDCAYCSQSQRFNTSVEPQPLMPLEQVVAAASQAKAKGATRFCMGAAWRSPKPKDFKQVLNMVTAIKALGLETCFSLGMLNAEQAQHLKQAGLDYYNHNLDTSPTYYAQIVSTHGYQDRLDTLAHVRAADLKVCCGGIVGMGECLEDRANLLLNLANLPKHPHSVPINQFIPITGTRLADEMKPIHPFEMVRCIATARILMPLSDIRLSAGRTEMSDELQALCFLAGANSIFYGHKLLTTTNPSIDEDQQLFNKLGLQTSPLASDQPSIRDNDKRSS